MQGRLLGRCVGGGEQVTRVGKWTGEVCIECGRESGQGRCAEDVGRGV